MLTQHRAWGFEFGGSFESFPTSGLDSPLFWSRPRSLALATNSRKIAGESPLRSGPLHRVVGRQSPSYMVQGPPGGRVHRAGPDGHTPSAINGFPIPASVVPVVNQTRTLVSAIHGRRPNHSNP